VQKNGAQDKRQARMTAGACVRSVPRRRDLRIVRRNAIISAFAWHVVRCLRCW
jgi:hypothetical protein